MIKRMIGGLLLLNLLSEDLEMNQLKQSFDSKDILEQLSDFKVFVDKNRLLTNKAKGLKPVLVHFRCTDYEIETIIQCNVSFSDMYSMTISGTLVDVNGNPFTLVINVVFEDANYEEYKIKSAKYTLQENIKISDSLVATIEYDTDGFYSDATNELEDNLKFVSLEIETTNGSALAIGKMNELTIVCTPFNTIIDNVTYTITTINIASNKKVTFSDIDGNAIIPSDTGMIIKINRLS